MQNYSNSDMTLSCGNCGDNESLQDTYEEFCSEISLIDRCVEYIENDGFVTCNGCQSGYYLNLNENKCDKLSTVANCAKYSSTADVCMEC